LEVRRILLDTNAYTGYLAGDKKVLETLGRADRIYMSIFVLGELHFGFRSGKSKNRNKEILSRFLDKAGVEALEGTEETGEIFAQVKTSLKQSGNPIPINDVWIAAHALETGAVLITYDRHFQAVPGLRVWDWLE
jgi:tRNA(fMet)-specific endonuclease VapC